MDRSNSFNLAVYNSLCTLGIPAHLSGYRFIKTTLSILESNPQAIYSVGKLMAEVAEKHNTTASKVSRNIQHALDCAKTDYVVQEKILGRARELGSTEFLATLSEVIKVKLATDQRQ